MKVNALEYYCLHSNISFRGYKFIKIKNRLRVKYIKFKLMKIEENEYYTILVKARRFGGHQTYKTYMAILAAIKPKPLLLPVLAESLFYKDTNSKDYKAYKRKCSDLLDYYWHKAFIEKQELRLWYGELE